MSTGSKVPKLGEKSGGRPEPDVVQGDDKASAGVGLEGGSLETSSRAASPAQTLDFESEGSVDRALDSLDSESGASVLRDVESEESALRTSNLLEFEGSSLLASKSNQASKGGLQQKPEGSDPSDFPEEPPPFLGSWKNVYWMLAIQMFAFAVLFYWLTRWAE